MSEVPERFRRNRSAAGRTIRVHFGQGEANGQRSHPLYSYGRFLAECVESIVTHDAVDVRVLIIDDASTDDSAVVATDIAVGDPRVDLVVHDSNKGHFATYNEGLLEWADGDYSVLISTDDKLRPGSLRRATSALEETPAMDQMARGFIIGATAGPTTLTGEGLQHADRHSPILGATNPAARIYDPAHGTRSPTS